MKFVCRVQIVKFLARRRRDRHFCVTLLILLWSDCENQVQSQNKTFFDREQTKIEEIHYDDSSDLKPLPFVRLAF